LQIAGVQAIIIDLHFRFFNFDMRVRGWLF
jgi:hypothetical protein